MNLQGYIDNRVILKRFMIIFIKTFTQYRIYIIRKLYL